MSGATKRQGESPVAHAACGLPPRIFGSSVVCPSCFDICSRSSLRDAVRAWNDIQGGIVTAAKTAAQRQRTFRARKAEQQMTEVRGIFAHPDDHEAVKAAAAEIARKRREAAKVIT